MKRFSWVLYIMGCIPLAAEGSSGYAASLKKRWWMLWKTLAALPLPQLQQVCLLWLLVTQRENSLVGQTHWQGGKRRPSELYTHTYPAFRPSCDRTMSASQSSQPLGKITRLELRRYRGVHTRMRTRWTAPVNTPGCLCPLSVARPNRPSLYPALGNLPRQAMCPRGNPPLGIASGDLRE